MQILLLLLLFFFFFRFLLSSTQILTSTSTTNTLKQGLSHKNMFTSCFEPASTSLIRVDLATIYLLRTGGHDLAKHSLLRGSNAIVAVLRAVLSSWKPNSACYRQCCGQPNLLPPTCFGSSQDHNNGLTKFPSIFFFTIEGFGYGGTAAQAGLKIVLILLLYGDTHIEKN